MRRNRSKKIRWEKFRKLRRDVLLRWRQARTDPSPYAQLWIYYSLEPLHQDVFYLDAQRKVDLVSPLIDRNLRAFLPKKLQPDEMSKDDIERILTTADPNDPSERKNCNALTKETEKRNTDFYSTAQECLIPNIHNSFTLLPPPGTQFQRNDVKNDWNRGYCK